MQRGITYGTFDLLHYGHINLLRHTKQHCKIVYLPRTPEISTTKIKNDMKG